MMHRGGLRIVCMTLGFSHDSTPLRDRTLKDNFSASRILPRWIAGEAVFRSDNPIVLFPFLERHGIMTKHQRVTLNPLWGLRHNTGIIKRADGGHQFVDDFFLTIERADNCVDRKLAVGAA